MAWNYHIISVLETVNVTLPAVRVTVLYIITCTGTLFQECKQKFDSGTDSVMNCLSSLEPSDLGCTESYSQKFSQDESPHF